jgi:hypothetical protein
VATFDGVDGEPHAAPTSGTGASPPDILPGSAAATLILIGIYYEGAAFMSGFILVFEAYLPGRWYYWAIPVLVTAAILLTRGLVITFRGYRLLAEEKRRGYTTALGDARQDPSLYYVDRKTLRIVAGPYEPRENATR